MDTNLYEGKYKINPGTLRAHVRVWHGLGGLSENVVLTVRWSLRLPAAPGTPGLFSPRDCSSWRWDLPSAHGFMAQRLLGSLAHCRVKGERDGSLGTVSQVGNLRRRERMCLGVCSEWKELDLSLNTDGRWWQGCNYHPEDVAWHEGLGDPSVRVLGHRCGLWHGDGCGLCTRCPIPWSCAAHRALLHGAHRGTDSPCPMDLGARQSVPFSFPEQLILFSAVLSKEMTGHSIASAATCPAEEEPAPLFPAALRVIAYLPSSRTYDTLR